MESKFHNDMQNKADRAKQFAPFDALKGFREALREKERVLVPKAELSQEQAEILDRRLHQIQVGDIITIIYFHQGEYEKVTGMVSAFSETSRTLSIVHTQISFDTIYDLQGNFTDN